MNAKTLAIGCDHAGYELKESLKKTLSEQGYELKDFGTHSGESTDYPDYAHSVASSVESNEVELGILICGSGNGINMTANKHQGVRSALCWQVDIAEMARLHNNANVIALPARYISVELAEEIVKTFLSTEFEGGRHARRVDKIGTEASC
jgi:ribose 5-phosphate isomerase B